MGQKCLVIWKVNHPAHLFHQNLCSKNGHFQPKPQYKNDVTCDITKPDVKDDEKRKHKWRLCEICSLIYKNQRHDFITKTLNSKLLLKRF